MKNPDKTMFASPSAPVVDLCLISRIKRSTGGLFYLRHITNDFMKGLPQ